MRAASDVGGLLRDLAPQVVGAVARRSGDFDAAEDAVQEALLAAAQHWPDEGIPTRPDAWLIQAAWRRLVDQQRSDRSRREREAAATRLASAIPSTTIDHDDSLTLLVMCCHPALTPASAIALTLRAAGGLTTAAIARAFLVPEATMAQRISRAKERIRDAGATFEMPDAAELDVRLGQVLRVLYLVFNEGYATTGASIQRVDLTDEAIRLARMLHGLRPGDPEVAGLLALMLLTDARREARTGPTGELVPLASQDRSRWDRQKVTEGLALLDGAIGRGRVGEYQVQAAIAALHDRAASADATDWPQIAALYRILEELTGSPIVTLNRAVAVGLADSPASGLAVADSVAGRLAGNYRLDAVRAYLLELNGDFQAAAASYHAAASHTPSLPEQRYLMAQAARLRSR